MGELDKVVRGEVVGRSRSGRLPDRASELVVKVELRGEVGAAREWSVCHSLCLRLRVHSRAGSDGQSCAVAARSPNALAMRRPDALGGHLPAAQRGDASHDAHLGWLNAQCIHPFECAQASCW
eukprot:301724-Pleurochrysis_carterae.AAC.2